MHFRVMDRHILYELIPRDLATFHQFDEVLLPLLAFPATLSHRYIRPEAEGELELGTERVIV